MAKADRAELAALVNTAIAAAKEAFDGAKPVPIRVVQHSNPLNDNSPVIRDYGVIEDGVCGFAWVNVRPATSALARYLKDVGLARKSYYGGIEVSMGRFFASQSLARNEAAADAFAKVLRQAGYDRVYSNSRMD